MSTCAECTNGVYAKGLCNKHWSRARRRAGLVKQRPATPTERSWSHMRNRCNNPRGETYRLYGGRGITVCERWDSFAAFVADMGERPAGTSLDRIDTNGNYEPGNCRWATHATQMNNTNANRFVNVDGARRTLAQAASEHGLSAGTLWRRLQLGWPIDRALRQPLRGCR